MLGRGLMRAARTGWFLVKIIIPLSAVVALLQWTRILEWIGRILAPAMSLFGLPGEAAVALVAGGLVGIYGGVAAASVLALTRVQMTILAMMILVAHNLIVESTVQSRSGVSGLKVSAVRVVTAMLLGWGLWMTLPLGSPESSTASNVHAATMAAVAGGPAAAKPASFGDFALAWATGETRLVLKIFAILAVLMVAMEFLRTYGALDALARPMRPVMRLLGLSERVTYLWLTATFLGISYGAGLIIEEAKERGRFRPGDLRDLHVSIGISHSLLEDTVLFAAVGASPLWLLLPRPIAAALAVRAVRRLSRNTAKPASATVEAPTMQTQATALQGEEEQGRRVEDASSIPSRTTAGEVAMLETGGLAGTPCTSSVSRVTRP